MSRRRPLLLATSFAALLCGCAHRPVDLSAVSSESELARYVGREITFQGTFQPTKELSISNGRISLEVHRPGTYELGKPTRVRGVLRSAAYPPREHAPDDHAPPAQAPPPGRHFYIE